jgi:hypothetical protein
MSEWVCIGGNVEEMRHPLNSKFFFRHVRSSPLPLVTRLIVQRNQISTPDDSLLCVLCPSPPPLVFLPSSAMINPDNDYDIAVYNNTLPPPPYSGAGDASDMNYDLTPTPQSQNRPRLPEERRNVYLRSRRFMQFSVAYDQCPMTLPSSSSRPLSGKAGRSLSVASRSPP